MGLVVFGSACCPTVTELDPADVAGCCEILVVSGRCCSGCLFRCLKLCFMSRSICWLLPTNAIFLAGSPSRSAILVEVYVCVNVFFVIADLRSVEFKSNHNKALCEWPYLDRSQNKVLQEPDPSAMKLSSLIRQLRILKFHC